MKKAFLFVYSAVLRLSWLLALCGLLFAWLSTQVSPEKQAWLALFGLSFPFWFLLAIVNLVFMLLRKRWRSGLILALGLILTGSLTTRTIAFGMADDETSGESLKVMSYNVRLFDLYNWTEGAGTRDKIFNFLDQNEVDVLCFQEFYFTQRKGVFDTRDTLIRFLPNTYFHEKYTHKLNGEQYFGVVTFSKYPIVGRGEIAFESDQNNYCIYTDILKGQDTVRIYNAHLASIRFQKEDYKALQDGPKSEDAMRLLTRLERAFIKRSSQVDLVRSHLERDTAKMVVLCGDFNDSPVSYAYERLTDYLDDSFVEAGSGLGSSYVGTFPSFRIDYILHSRHFKASDFTTHAVDFSDHRPIQANLSFER